MIVLDFQIFSVHHIALNWPFSLFHVTLTVSIDHVFLSMILLIWVTNKYTKTAL